MVVMPNFKSRTSFPLPPFLVNEAPQWRGGQRKLLPGRQVASLFSFSLLPSEDDEIGVEEEIRDELGVPREKSALVGFQVFFRGGGV